MTYEQCIDQMEKMALIINKRLETILCEGLTPPLTFPNIRLLSILKTSEETTMTDIANHYGITLSGATGLVDRMVELKLVSRERRENDRRIVVIHITEKGREQLDRIKTNSIKLFDGCFSDLSNEEIDIYFKVLNKITSCILSDKEK